MLFDSGRFEVAVCNLMFAEIFFGRHFYREVDVEIRSGNSYPIPSVRVSAVTARPGRNGRLRANASWDYSECGIEGLIVAVAAMRVAGADQSCITSVESLLAVEFDALSPGKSPRPRVSVWGELDSRIREVVELIRECATAHGPDVVRG